MCNSDFAGKVECMQDIQVQGLSENMRNQLTFFDFQNNSFSVEMENQNVGRIVGSGVYDYKLIGWNFGIMACISKDLRPIISKATEAI